MLLMLLIQHVGGKFAPDIPGRGFRYRVDERWKTGAGAARDAAGPAAQPVAAVHDTGTRKTRATGC